MDGPYGWPGWVGAMEGLEGQGRPPEPRGGQGQAVKGLRKRVMDHSHTAGSRAQKVLEWAEQWEVGGLQGVGGDTAGSSDSRGVRKR